MSSLFECRNKILSTCLLLPVSVWNALAQSPGLDASPPTDSFLDSYGLYLGLLVVLTLGVGAIFLARKRATKVSSKVRKDAKRGGTDRRKSGDARKAFVEKKRAEASLPGRNQDMPGTILEIPAAAVPKLPVFSFVRLERTPPFMKLPDSADEDLLCAIDQTREDFISKVFETYNEFTTMSGFNLKSAEDAMAFNYYHEAVHTGMMMSIRKFI